MKLSKLSLEIVGAALFALAPAFIFAVYVALQNSSCCIDQWPEPSFDLFIWVFWCSFVTIALGVIAATFSCFKFYLAHALR
jgi:hypothetical protein